MIEVEVNIKKEYGKYYKFYSSFTIYVKDSDIHYVITRKITNKVHLKIEGNLLLDKKINTSILYISCVIF